MRETTIKGQTLLLKRCALHKFRVTDVQNTRMIRLRVIKGPNTRDQGAFCAFHTFLVEVQINAGYIYTRDTCIITT